MPPVWAQLDPDPSQTLTASGHSNEGAEGGEGAPLWPQKVMGKSASHTAWFARKIWGTTPTPRAFRSLPWTRAGTCALHTPSRVMRAAGLCVLPAGGSPSCRIDLHGGRNMCAMHGSMGRLKMRVCSLDDRGKLCCWHRQHSEGHVDLRRAPRGDARSRRLYPARHVPPASPRGCPVPGLCRCSPCGATRGLRGSWV